MGVFALAHLDCAVKLVARSEPLRLRLALHCATLLRRDLGSPELLERCAGSQHFHHRRCADLIAALLRMVNRERAAE